MRNPTKITAKPNDEIQPDEWPGYARLIEADDFDKQYFGADVLRVETNTTLIPTLAVKIEITGRHVSADYWRNPKIRCRIEFPQDDGTSVVTHGWLIVH